MILSSVSESKTDNKVISSRSSEPITKQSVPKPMTKSSVSPSETDNKVIRPRKGSHQKGEYIHPNLALIDLCETTNET